MSFNNFNQQSSNMQDNTGPYQQQPPQQPQQPAFHQRPGMPPQQSGFPNPQQGQFSRPINQDQHRQMQFIQQQSGTPEMTVGNYLRQPGALQAQRMQQLHSGQSQGPHQTQASALNHNQPESGNNFAAPGSTAQPNSMSSTFVNPPSSAIPGSGGQSQNPPPNSVGQSLNPHAPSSVGQALNPLSTGGQPTSVGQLAPTSVGPTSAPQHGPTSVNVGHPTSVGHGPTSVQGPTSVHAGPTSVGPPGSLQTANPGSVIQEKPGVFSNAIDFSYPPKIIDPVAELKMLILKDLRKATQAISEQIADAIMFAQEQQHYSMMEGNPRSGINPHSLAPNPLSVNPQSIHNPQSISGPKSIDDSLHKKRMFSKDKYDNAWMNFFAICDKVEAKASLIMEVYEMQKRFDKMCEIKVPADIMNQGYPALIQSFLDNVRADREKVLNTVNLLSDSMQEFRKITDEGEFVAAAAAKKNANRFFDLIESDDFRGDSNEDQIMNDVPDTAGRKSPRIPRPSVRIEKKTKTKRALTAEEKRIKDMRAKNWQFFEDADDSDSSDSETVQDRAPDHRQKDYFFPSRVSVAKMSDSDTDKFEQPKRQKLDDSVVKIGSTTNSASSAGLPDTQFGRTTMQFPQTESSDSRIETQIFRNPNAQQMEEEKAEMLGYEDDEEMGDECDPPPFNPNV